MTAIDFPNSPSTNDTFSSGGVTWRYDGTKWRIVAGSILSSTNPTTIEPDASAAVGSGTTAARADHTHAIAAASAGTITGTNAEGTSTSFARADHDHDLSITPIWTAPTLTNSWVNFGSGYNNAGYYKDKSGFVHLRGLVKNGTSGASIFTLPSGSRPTGQCLFRVDANGGIGRVDVNTNGTVVLVTGQNPYVSLDGIYFSTA